MAEKPGDGLLSEKIPRSEAETRKRRRAENIARAEFGRFYWNGRLECELRQSLSEATKRKRKSKD